MTQRDAPWKTLEELVADAKKNPGKLTYGTAGLGTNSFFNMELLKQAYNIEMPLGQQITMLLLLMVTSKGMAGVPRASLVVIAATLASFNIPEAGLLLIIGIDQFLDMGRSATNVLGNTLATAAIAKWEGEQVDLEELEAALAPKAA